MMRGSSHTFHIPVMGLAYTVDAPAKLARFGISSVVSIIEDNLLEQMRRFYCIREGEEYRPIQEEEADHRALRVTAYLNLLGRIVKRQTEELRAEEFTEGTEIVKYFELLPSYAPVRILFEQMRCMDEGAEKSSLQEKLRHKIAAGSIDVNIMTKCDKTNYSKSGEALPPEYSDAMAALRGFAMSELSSAIVFSAGLNPRLYSYCESFRDFYPDGQGQLRKKIILKVSDYRSALVQGKVFAKKGIWVSEFRLESGLNCGGHAFATEGLLLGPILEEFKNNRGALSVELFRICNAGLEAKGYPAFGQPPPLKFSVQGGIGTSTENDFLLNYYGFDSTGWGSPFLLVPEVTNVDRQTLSQLTKAQKEDYYLSDASPLGIPLNNFRKSSSEKQRKKRIKLGRPGSPCYKKFLAFNTEFTPIPICAASRQYQHLKTGQLRNKGLNDAELCREFDQLTAKECLCEGLSVSALLVNNIPVPHGLSAASICPGPNLAYFSRIMTLKEITDHIYGRDSMLNALDRPHMFINELYLYVNYLKREIEKITAPVTDKQMRFFRSFRENLICGIAYYNALLPHMQQETTRCLADMKNHLFATDFLLRHLLFPTEKGNADDSNPYPWTTEAGMENGKAM